MTSLRNFEVPLALNGLQSMVPTRTTSTLTPTLSQKYEPYSVREVEPHQNEAGFVPPPPPVNPVMPLNGNIFMSFVNQKNWQGATVNSVPSPQLPPAKSPPITQAQNPNPTRKNTGGRRPIKDKSISPEEEQRRQVRRERNKQAAARCRKRRVDHTLELETETKGLEEKKMNLQIEIDELQKEKEELESLLEMHEPQCCLKNSAHVTSTTANHPMDLKPILLTIKPDPDSDLDLPRPLKSKLDPIISNPVLSQQPSKPFSSQRVRPTSLTLNPRPAEMMDLPTSAGTVTSLNFDSLMDHTGYTPVSGPLIPSCSSQQRNSGSGDLSTPDSASSKLVSL